MNKNVLELALRKINDGMQSLIENLGTEITINNVRGFLENIIPNIAKHSLYGGLLDRICTKYGIYDMMAERGAEYLVTFFHESIAKGLMRPFTDDAMENINEYAKEIVRQYIDNNLNMNRFRNISMRFGFVFNFKTINGLIRVLSKEADIERR